MYRPILLGLAALFLAACESESPTETTPIPAGDPEVEQPAPPVSPPGGIPRVQADHDLYAAEVARIEKELGAEKAPDQHQTRLLRNLGRGIDNLILVATKGRDAEAEDELRNTHARLRTRFSDLMKEQRILWREITEINGLLEQIGKGLGAPPQGFTEAELRDKLVDLRNGHGRLGKQRDEVTREMKKCEEQLARGKAPPGERSLFSDELEGLEKLKGRVEALLARLG